ncbi:hypothetical protein [Rhizobium sullae]|uniref:hypothetical protein n=1 Tax=Rhizobium sullae TaxID=50338 RepID=UPI000B3593D5|nr:hypothetical protein [Rhizobium sullae]
MIITEMKWRECVDFQSGHRLGRVVCAKDDWAYVVPIYHAFTKKLVLRVLTLRQKVEWMRVIAQELTAR